MTEGQYRIVILSENDGAGNFGSQEIYGVINDDFINSSVPDAIWYTIAERRDSDLPDNYFIIYHTGIPLC